MIVNALEHVFKKINYLLLAGGVLISVAYCSSTLAADKNAEAIQIPTVTKYPIYPKVKYGTDTQAEQLKRGEYLTKLGDCLACHTEPNTQKAFAGGYPFATPFGTIYSPNITPDQETGIGKWTDEEFFKAVRNGVSPHGSFYYPAFPYPYFNKLSDQDLRDIKAYLNAIPAIKQENRKNEMMFPFNWRLLQLGWRSMFFYMQKTGPYKPDSSKSEAWNRGAYLVLGLGHCDMCHTPSYYAVFKKFILAAPNRKYHLAGGFVNGFYAPNITATGVLKNTTPQQLTNVFKKNKLIEGGAVQGPMLEANEDSLKYLTDSDIAAIHTYLTSVKSKALPQPKIGTGLAAGKKVYEQYCVGCHMTGAGGAPKLGNSTDWAPRIAQGKERLYEAAIKGLGSMPPKGTCGVCSDEDIKNTVDYMITESQEGKATATMPKPITPLTLEDGKRIYQKSCQSCHDGSHPGAPKVGDKETWKPLIKQGMDVLILNSIHGYKTMPPKGNCKECNDAEIIAAVKYMVNESKTEGNYNLW